MSSSNDASGGEEEDGEIKIPQEVRDQLRRIVDLRYGGDGILPSDIAAPVGGNGDGDVVEIYDSSDEEFDEDGAIDLTGGEDEEKSSGTDEDDQEKPKAPPTRRAFEAKDVPQSLQDEMTQDKYGPPLFVSGQPRDLSSQNTETIGGSDENADDDDDEGTNNMDSEDFVDDDDGGKEDLTSGENRRIGRELLGFEQKESANDKDDEDLADGTIGNGDDEDGKKNTGTIQDWSVVSSLEYENSKTGVTTKFEVGKPYRLANKYEFIWIWRFTSARSVQGAKIRDAEKTFLGAPTQLKQEMYEEDRIVNRKLFDVEKKMDLPFEKVKVIHKQPYNLDDLLELEDGYPLLQENLPDWTYTRRIQTQQSSENPSSSYKFGYYYQPLPPILPDTSLESESTDGTVVEGLPDRKLPEVQGNLSTRQSIPTREGLRRGDRRKVRVMDLFEGFGGMHQGMLRILEFEHVVGVELDPTAVKTFKENYPNDYIWQGDVRAFLRKVKTDPVFRAKFGRIDYIHVSPPCQGFSGANINGGKNDEKNNNLSLIVIDYIMFFRPDAISFENVEGMWRGKHVHYLRAILKLLLHCGYHFHWDVLKACDYGDPQSRRRLIILASKLHIPVPALPDPTHGKDGNHGTRLLPYVTVGDILSNFPERKQNDKYDGLRPTNPGQSKNPDAIVLDPNKVAPTLRATGPPVFHPFEDRALTVREYLALFNHDAENFRVGAKKSGNPSSQYRQIGNSVPVKLAEAIARSVAEVLRYEWKDIETTNPALNQSSSTISSCLRLIDEQMEEQGEGMPSHPPASMTTSTNDESGGQMINTEEGNTTATSVTSHQ